MTSLVLPQLALFLGGQIIVIAVFSGAGLIAIQRSQRALDEEIRQLPMRQSPLEAFQRFIAARGRIYIGLRRVNTYLLIALMVLIFFGQIALASTPDSSNVFLPTNILAGLIAVIVGMYAGGYVADLVGSTTVDAQALSAFQISAMQQSEIISVKMR